MHASLKAEVAGREKDVCSLPLEIPLFLPLLPVLVEIDFEIDMSTYKASVRFSSRTQLLNFYLLNSIRRNTNVVKILCFSYAITQIFYPTVSQYVRFYVFINTL